MKDVFEVLMYAFAIYGAAKFTLSCVDVIFNRNTKEGTPSASHNSASTPCYSFAKGKPCQLMVMDMCSVRPCQVTAQRT